MENKIDERKAKLKLVLSNKKSLLIYVILFIIILSGVFIRTAGIQNLQGKYMLSMDDPYIFLRYSEYIAEHGSLMEVDNLRYAPLGIETDK
ncbi:hypothetical protein HYT58_02045, partial [Candidatus Woesearchaeota archaeon]|nr:hypothetical protein [Candidatus Woesearchaeota archaeon]